MRSLVILALVACACPSKQAPGPGSGSQAGGAGAPVLAAKICDDVKVKVEQLYRAEAMIKEPKRVAEAVADNAALVMTDCATDPARLVPCLAGARSIGELEQHCLVPLDEEGTEGEGLGR